MTGSVVIAPDGKIVGYDEAEARRARVSQWTAIGRDFYRDLAWTLGRDVVDRIRRFQDEGLDADQFVASVIDRTGRQEVAITLARIDGNTHVTIAQRSARTASRA